MRNLGNKLANGMDKVYWLAILQMSTFLMRINCYVRKINLGFNSQFFGLMKMVKGSNNIINIGNNCTFRSKSKSNLIGINRPSPPITR